LAKEYSIPSATITVQINKDGSANVTEERRYSFDGSFSWADEWIELEDGYRIYGLGITDAKNNEKIRFEQSETDDKFYLKW